MKLLTIMTYVGVVGLTVLGLEMAKTNPSQAEYEDYAVQELTGYLKKNVCKKTTSILQKLIKFDCEKLVDSANPQMRDIIANSTERQDFVIFSIYRTDLKLNSWIPSYKLETVGAFDKFYTYNTEQQ
ncbi:MAG: DUF4359 domain-containing protein [Stigonema ocellatum SAG 48.90 = DSM 106950]|nr:DUF4359 domain-containing protein [Stigonema ocellatum SAG 48.90 = DSM 106950]